jgi:predicted metalloendopeptidase
MFVKGKSQVLKYNIKKKTIFKFLQFSLVKVRVMAVMRNSPDFQEAFQCKKGDQMVAETRCKIW